MRAHSFASAPGTACIAGCRLTRARACQRAQSQAAVDTLSMGFKATLYSRCSRAPPSSISVMQTEADGRFLAIVKPSHPHPAPSSMIFSPAHDVEHTQVQHTHAVRTPRCELVAGSGDPGPVDWPGRGQGAGARLEEANGRRAGDTRDPHMHHRGAADGARPGWPPETLPCGAPQPTRARPWCSASAPCRRLRGPRRSAQACAHGVRFHGVPPAGRTL